MVTGISTLKCVRDIHFKMKISLFFCRLYEFEFWMELYRVCVCVCFIPQVLVILSLHPYECLLHSDSVSPYNCLSFLAVLVHICNSSMKWVCVFAFLCLVNMWLCHPFCFYSSLSLLFFHLKKNLKRILAFIMMLKKFFPFTRYVSP